MLPLEALRGMKVMFATPCYGSAGSSPYIASIFSLAGDCARIGLPCQLELYSESLVPRARNALVATKFLDHGYTHLCWLDADILFSSSTVFRLLLADKDVVAAVPPLKQFNWPAEGLPAGMTEQEFNDLYTFYPFNPLNAEAVPMDKDGFAQVKEAPTGVMVIKVGVFDWLREAYPERQYLDDNQPGKDFWDFFTCMIEPGTRRYLSEDYGFCRLWRESGGEVWIDPQAKLMHLGQHLFKGCLADSLTAQRKFLEVEA